jgi:hypothetical protein
MPKPTRITRIGTVIVPIADQDRALAFYVDTPSATRTATASGWCNATDDAHVTGRI